MVQGWHQIPIYYTLIRTSHLSATTNNFREANMDALIVKGGLGHFDIVALNFWGS
jgi:hypothetical protein